MFSVALQDYVIDAMLDGKNGVLKAKIVIWEYF